MLNYTEILKQKISVEGRLNISDVIKSLLKDASDDIKRQYMYVGQRYYDGQHDVLQKDFTKRFVYETDEKTKQDYWTLVENKNNSNHHNVHNFHQLFVDQKAAYVVGKTPTITVEGAEKNPDLKSFEDEVTKYADEYFADLLVDIVVRSSNKGVEYLHPYVDENGEFGYTIIPAEEVIVYYDSSRQTSLEGAIRFYSMQVVLPGGKNVERKKVEWWTKKDVTYYTEDDEGNFVVDPDIKFNPAPHFWSLLSVDNSLVKRTPQSWGRVPFIPLKNNSNCTSDLAKIKGLQDAYNIISSTTTNSQIDLVELFWILQGYGGETAKAIAAKLQVNKAVSITDTAGKIAAHQVTLSVAEKKEWLDMLRKDMYHIGMALDVNDETFGSAPSGVALEFKYEPLNEKADNLIRKLQITLKDFFWFVTQYINYSKKEQWDSKLIKTTIHKNKHINVPEMIDAIMASRDLVPDKLLLEKHPLVDDVNEAIKEMDEQRNASAKRQQEMFGSPLNSPPVGGSDEE